MNIAELNAEMGRYNLSIPKLAKLVGIGKKAMYERFSGKSQFKQNEILAIKNILHLDNEKLNAIFFNDVVS